MTTMRLGSINEFESSMRRVSPGVEGRRCVVDPQRDESPALVVITMQWMPRPSLRTAVGLGAIALGVIATNRRRPPDV